MELTVRRLYPNDSVDELTDLLHDAYRPLGAMGLNYTAVDQDSATTLRRINRAECLIRVSAQPSSRRWRASREWWAQPELALDTAEPARHLVDYSARRGFRPVDTIQWKGKTYRSVVMSMDLR